LRRTVNSPRKMRAESHSRMSGISPSSSTNCGQGRGMGESMSEMRGQRPVQSSGALSHSRTKASPPAAAQTAGRGGGWVNR
jgi:hypothetical protein